MNSTQPIRMEDRNETRKSVTKNGLTKSVTIREVENGFIIEIEKHGDVDGEYMSEHKTYISTANPMEKEEKKEGVAEGGILDVISELNI